jgi:glutamine synthetase
VLAGTNGVKDEEKLVWGDCTVDPASLTKDDKAELGITQMLPLTFEEALKTLQDDAELVELMGADLVERYIAVKNAELDLLGDMSEDVCRQWLMERY